MDECCDGECFGTKNDYYIRLSRMERKSMNLQIANQKEIKGQWVVCELEDGPQITKVEKAVNNNARNKLALWGFWQSEGSIKGDGDSII